MYYCAQEIFDCILLKAQQMVKKKFFLNSQVMVSVILHTPGQAYLMVLRQYILGSTGTQDIFIRLNVSKGTSGPPQNATCQHFGCRPGQGRNAVNSKLSHLTPQVACQEPRLIDSGVLVTARNTQKARWPVQKLVFHLKAGCFCKFELILIFKITDFL